MQTNDQKSKEKETPQTHDIPHEEVINLPVTAEDSAKMEIKKFNVSREWIASKKKEYANLKVVGPEDKAGQQKVTEAWREIKGKRLAVSNVHKELKAEVLVKGRIIDQEKNELTALLEEIEDPLYSEMKRVEREKEELELKRQQEEQNKLDARVKELLEAGIAFTGRFYTIGEADNMISVDIATLKAMNDEEYLRLLEMVQKKNTEIQEREKERIRKENEERQQLKEQQEKQQRIAEEQQKKEAELKQQQEEMLAERRSGRVQQLEALGFVFMNTRKVWDYITLDLNKSLAFIEDVAKVESNEWYQILEEAKKIKLDIDQAQAQKNTSRQKYNDRVLKLSQIGITNTGRPSYFEYTARDKKTVISLSSEDINEFSDDDFEGSIGEFIVKIANYNTNLDNEEKEEQEKQQRIALHERELITMGFGKYEDKTFGFHYQKGSEDHEGEYVEFLHEELDCDDDEWAELIEKAKLDLQKIADNDAKMKLEREQEEEKERLSNLNDAERLEEYLKKLREVPVPEISNEDIADVVNTISIAIDNSLHKMEKLKAAISND